MSWKAGGVFGVSGLLMLGYFYYSKQQIDLERDKRRNESIGKPLVGGPFSLVNQDGIAVTNDTYKGKLMLIYFGYTVRFNNLQFCPDVCPEELDKMTEVVNQLEQRGLGDKLVPIFVSCDPKRDSIKAIREYLKEFHPKFIGLTGFQL